MKTGPMFGSYTVEDIHKFTKINHYINIFMKSISSRAFAMLLVSNTARKPYFFYKVHARSYLPFLFCNNGVYSNTLGCSLLLASSTDVILMYVILGSRTPFGLLQYRICSC